MKLAKSIAKTAMSVIGYKGTEPVRFIASQRIVSIGDTAYKIDEVEYKAIMALDPLNRFDAVIFVFNSYQVK